MPMDDFLVGSVKHNWPYYLLALVVCELLLLVRGKRGLRLEIIVAFAICVVWTINGQIQERTSWAAEN